MAAGKAAGKAAASFDEIIRAGRQKRKNEELASQILGKNRKAGAGKKTQDATSGGSLASRIGVTKRSAPTPAKPKKNNNKPVVSAAPPATPKGPRAKNANRRRPDKERLLTALDPANGQSTVRDNTGGLSIKGASSGPFVIVGSNFAPGTTAADIQSALEPVAGPVLNCWITGNYPAVTAEITFAEKWSAENTVANFHNQKADGRVLSMRWKASGASAEPSFNDLREQADQQRRRLRGADPAIQDGTYGFGAQNSYARGGRGNRGQGGSGAYQNTQDQGLYSDQMMVDAPPQDSRYRSRRHR